MYVPCWHYSQTHFLSAEAYLSTFRPIIYTNNFHNSVGGVTAHVLMLFLIIVLFSIETLTNPPGATAEWKLRLSI